MNGINIKYFIIAVASIFIALGIGIIIGFSMNSEKFVQRQFQQQLNLIDKNLTNLKKENDRLLKEIDDYKLSLSQKDKINNALFSAYLKCGKANSNVSLIITSTDYSYNDLIDFLKSNGIKINRIIKLKSNILSILKENTSNVYDNGYIKNIFSQISTHTVFDYKSDIVKWLIEKNYIEENRLNGEISDTVIIAGGNTMSNNYYNMIDKNIISYLKGFSDLNIIGVTQSYSEINYCELYKTSGLSSVDNIDDISGKLSLIELIRGNVGNFGIKKEANSLIPSNFLSIDVSEKKYSQRRNSLLTQYEKIDNILATP